MPKVVDHNERRQDFIEAAYETILERGLERTTVRAVAKKAGYTTGALVHYFGDKDELIQQALTQFGSEVRNQMLTAQRTSRGREALRELMLQALPTNRESAGRWRVWLALWYRSESSADMRNEERSRYSEWLGRLESVLRESVADGELPASISIADEARALVALIDGTGVQYLMSGARGSKKRMTTLVDNCLERLYQTPLRDL